MTRICIKGELVHAIGRQWRGLTWTFCLVLFTVACSGPKVDLECQIIKIVAVTHSEETGNPDWYTVVEFPDSTRRFRFNKWGEVGDMFCAKKESQQYFKVERYNGQKPKM